jgi:uncharacterized protein (TIGR00369 family)
MNEKMQLKVNRRWMFSTKGLQCWYYFAMKINYLKSFDRGEIFAEAKIIFKGSQTAVGEVEVRDSDGNLVAKALSTYAIIKRNS